jgi:hypothetical protein
MVDAANPKHGSRRLTVLLPAVVAQECVAHGR